MLAVLQAYLLGQLTRGRQHNDSGQPASLSPVGGVVRQQALHYGQHKGKGLALPGPAQSAEHLSAQAAADLVLGLKEPSLFAAQEAITMSREHSKLQCIPWCTPCPAHKVKAIQNTGESLGLDAE